MSPKTALENSKKEEELDESDYNTNMFIKSKNKRSDLYESSEKFVENEKNLSEDRLKKKDERDSSVVNISGLEQ